jgi:PAS domain S-box-containing protein
MGALMRATDWSRTALGPVDGWPQSLRTALSMLMNTGFPMYIAWGERYTQFYNDSYRPILGSVKHPRAMGSAAQETFSEIWNLLGPMFQSVMGGQTVTVNDFLFLLDRHGFIEECYFIFSYSPIRDETGKVGGVLVICTETTDRVIGARRMALLQQLGEKTQHAGSATRACEIAADVLSGDVADVPFALIYIVEKDEQVARLACATVIPAGGRANPQQVHLSADAASPIARVLATGQSELIEELDVTLPTEAPSSPRAYAVPILTPGADRATGVLLAGLSPRLAIDEKYRSFLELVAGHVGTAIASARALEEAKARAEALAEIDRAKTAFFSNVSHEFRTPLTLMLGPAEDALAERDRLSTADAERWSLVHRNAVRLAKLVNTLLDFSRIEAGRVDAVYEPTDLPALTGELASMFRSAVERAGLRLELDLPAIPESAYVDRDMWEKIVMNLLSNALKFTFEGKIDVRLAFENADFVLTVRDTGTGIPAAEVPSVFDRFHRVKGARSRTHEGTGIGLALVSELVKLHGGAVSVESQAGLGTCFTVRLPAGSAHLPADRIGAARALPKTTVGAAPFVEEALRWVGGSSDDANEAPAAGARRARIVLADDNADMRDYLARLLRERWDVEAVADGRQALAAIRRERPDLVLADVMMPDVDGFGLLREVRADPALHVLPVILLSARAGEEATAEGLSAGASDYIVKPFSARELLVRVAAKLAAAQIAREAQEIEQAARDRLYRHYMQAPFPVAVLRGADHVLELANAAALQAWGKEGSIVGKPLRDGIPELKGQPFLGYLDEVRESGVAHEARGALAMLARTPEQPPEAVYFDFVYAPLREADGTVDGVLVSGFEVTAQVRAAQQLSGLLDRAEASERQFREVVENLPQLAWTAGADGGVEYFNQRWYEYTGRSPEQSLGWDWTEALEHETVSQMSQRWRRSLETGEAFEMEYTLRCTDGSRRWFLSQVRPLRDSSGAIVRWFGSSTDIDDRRRNEDFKEKFVGILGHDLRDPLQTVLATARLLASRPDTSAELRKRLDRIETSGVRMQRMIEQLLDLTRARLAGGIPVELTPAPVDLGPLVTKIVDEVRGAQPQVAIEVVVQGDCAARIDPDRFEQVISNLVGNAVTHGDGRGVLVSLASRSDEVVFAVHNGGRPIAPEMVPLLFSPFSRVEKAAGRSAGLGLGLYISERIVDAHGGHLAVESDGSGTQFEVRLPRAGCS